MEIKFWDSENNNYVKHNGDYVTADEESQCWVYCDIKDEYVYAENITAHFYINGERVA